MIILTIFCKYLVWFGVFSTEPKPTSSLEFSPMFSNVFFFCQCWLLPTLEHPAVAVKFDAVNLGCSTLQPDFVRSVDVSFTGGHEVQHAQNSQKKCSSPDAANYSAPEQTRYTQEYGINKIK
jgi:hypothetical protein